MTGMWLVPRRSLLADTVLQDGGDALARPIASTPFVLKRFTTRLRHHPHGFLLFGTTA